MSHCRTLITACSRLPTEWGLDVVEGAYLIFILLSPDSVKRQLLSDAHPFHCDNKLVFGEIRTCLEVSSD